MFSMTGSCEKQFYAVAEGRQCVFSSIGGFVIIRLMNFRGNLYNKFPDVSNCVKYLLAHSLMSKSDIRMYIDDPDNGIALKHFKIEMASAFWESNDLANNEAVDSDSETTNQKGDDNYVSVVLNSVLVYVVNSINNSAAADIK